MSGRRFTAEEKEWLKTNAESDNYQTYDELYEAYSKIFGTDKNKQGIADLCTRRLGLSRARFAKCTQFGTGAKPKHPVGAEVIKTIRGNKYIWIKVSDTYHKGKTSMTEYCENWMPKQRYVYEQNYGKIPKNKIVVFLDNNYLNCDISNLYCVDRKIHARMSQNQWYTDNQENTLTAIKWCELFYAIKKARLNNDE